MDGNLIDSRLMATSFEGCGEELVEAGDGGGFVDESSGEDDDVGVVVLADEVGDFGTPDKTSSYALVLVEGHADALARTADGDAGIDGTILDGIAKGVTEVGVVAAGFTAGAEVAKDDAALCEVLLNEFFKRKASVVAGQAYYFDVHGLMNPSCIIHNSSLARQSGIGVL